MPRGWIATAASLALAAWGSSAPAEPRGPAPSLQLATEAFPASGIRDPDAGTFETGLEVRLRAYELRFLQPYTPAPGRSTLLYGVSYRRTELRYDGWDFTQAPSRAEELHDLQLELHWMRRTAPGRSRTIFLQPGLYGDLNGDTADALRVHGGIRWSRHLPRRTMTYGLVYTPGFGRPFPLPLLGLTWTNGHGLSLDALVPDHAEVWYTPDGTISWGLVARLMGNQYAVDFPGRVDNLKLAQTTLAVALRAPVVEGLRFTVMGGAAGVLRRFEADDENTEVADLHMKDGFFARASLDFGG